MHDSEFTNYEPLTNPRRRRGFGRSLPETDSYKRPETSQPVANVAPISTVPNSIPSEITEKFIDRPPSIEASTRSTLLRRGHGLSFFGLILFTAFVYFRPYELAGLSFLQSGAKWIAIATLLVFIPVQLGLEGNLTTRPREVNLILLLTLTAVLSLPMAINLGEGWDHLVEFMKVVAMFIVMINVVRTEKRLNWMFWMALAVSVTTSLSALSDYRAGRLLEGGERIKGAIGGLFENPNDLALHLVTMVPLALGLLLSRRSNLKKVLFSIVILLMAAAIVVTFSRGGFLGLIAASLVLAYKFGRKNRALVISICVLVFGCFIIFSPSEYGGRLVSIWSGDALGSASARQELFWRSLWVSLRYPIFGIGIGNFHYRSIHEMVSHNAYTQVSAELGMAALVFYVLFLVSSLKRLRNIEKETLAKRDQTKFYCIAVALQASIIGYMVSSFFASVAFLWYPYYLVGYAICFNRIYSGLSEGKHPETRGLTQSALKNSNVTVAGLY